MGADSFRVSSIIGIYKTKIHMRRLIYTICIFIKRTAERLLIYANIVIVVTCKLRWILKTLYA